MSEPHPQSAEDRSLRNVLVVGGGVEGWLCAIYLKRAFPALNLAILDTPLDAAAQPHVATNPAFRSFFLGQLGLDEDTIMRACGANFRAAVKYVNWRIPRTHTPDDYYYRMFDAVPDCDGVSLAHYWVQRRLWGDRQPLEYACHKEPKILDVRLGPRHLDGTSAMRYGWQFDTRPLLALLATEARATGVVHYPETFGFARLADDASLEGVQTRSGLSLAADLFIDCSGARSLLIGQALAEPFIAADGLPCDSVVASTFVVDDALGGIEPYSSAIALRHGWSWKMPLASGLAAGYVYNGRFATRDQAAAELCTLYGTTPNQQPLLHARFRAGHRRRSWVKNCVALGSAAACVEPLESSSADETLLALEQLALHFPDRGLTDLLRDRFNERVSARFNELTEVTRLHYRLTPRDDSAFWRHCRRHLATDAARATCSSRLQPGYHVLAGLGSVPLQPLPRLRYQSDSQRRAQRMFEQIQEQADELYAQLPTNDTLLRHLHAI